jgi:hypothetical protein
MVGALFSHVNAASAAVTYNVTLTTLQCTETGFAHHTPWRHPILINDVCKRHLLAVRMMHGCLKFIKKW